MNGGGFADFAEADAIDAETGSDINTEWRALCRYLEEHPPPPREELTKEKLLNAARRLGERRREEDD